jgi:SPP1 gp7 family putative phage head morphogenesis protein
MSKDTLDDPSSLKRYIAEFEKKLIKLIRVHRAKSMKELLDYPELTPMEKRFILEHYDKLLADLKKELDDDSAKMIYQAGFVALALYRMNQEEYLVAIIEEVPPEQRLKAVWSQAQTNKQIESVFRERSTVLMNNVVDELKKDVDLTLQESDLQHWDRKKLQERLDMKYKKAEYKAAMIARTEMMYAFNQQIVDAAKKGGWTRFQWVTANDELVCPVCGPRHGRVYHYDNIPEIPVHPNCFLPGTRYESPSNIIGGLRAMYDGAVVRLVIPDKGDITVTPNHMFLTPNGFVKAKSLRKGDYVINRTDTERIITTDPNDNQMPSRVEDVFDSLKMSRGMFSTSMPVSSKDLHSDGQFVNTNIDIILPDGLLGGAGESPIVKKINEKLFSWKNSGTNLVSNGSLDKFLLGALYSTNRIVSGVGNGEPFFGGELRHPEIHGVASSSLNDAVFVQNPDDNVSANTEMLSQLLNTHSRVVETNKVGSVQIVPYHGWVYDFQTINSLCFGNSFLTSNCRCAVIPFDKK